MRLANAFCRFVEMAQAPIDDPASDAPDHGATLEVLTLGLD
jgi:hypothetical protein